MSTTIPCSSSAARSRSGTSGDDDGVLGNEPSRSPRTNTARLSRSGAVSAPPTRTVSRAVGIEPTEYSEIMRRYILPKRSKETSESPAERTYSSSPRTSSSNSFSFSSASVFSPMAASVCVSAFIFSSSPVFSNSEKSLSAWVLTVALSLPLPRYESTSPTVRRTFSARARRAASSSDGDSPPEKPLILRPNGSKNPFPFTFQIRTYRSNSARSVGFIPSIYPQETASITSSAWNPKRIAEKREERKRTAFFSVSPLFLCLKNGIS